MQGNYEVYIMRGPFQGQHYFSLAEHFRDSIRVRPKWRAISYSWAAVVLWGLAPEGRRSCGFTRVPYFSLFRAGLSGTSYKRDYFC